MDVRAPRRPELFFCYAVSGYTYQPGMNGLLTQEQVALGELYWSVMAGGVLSRV